MASRGPSRSPRDPQPSGRTPRARSRPRRGQRRPRAPADAEPHAPIHVQRPLNTRDEPGDAHPETGDDHGHRQENEAHRGGGGSELSRLQLRHRGDDPLRPPRRLLVHDLHEPREPLLLFSQRGAPRVLRLDGGEDRGQQLHRLRTAELPLRLLGLVLLLQPVERCAHVPSPSAAGGSRRTPARPPG